MRTIQLHITLDHRGSKSSPLAFLTSGRPDSSTDAEVGRGSFEVYQGANFDQLCAWVRSEGKVDDEAWIWIDDITSFCPGNDNHGGRIYQVPSGSNPDQRLRFKLMQGTDVNLPSFEAWKSMVVNAANPDATRPHFLLKGVTLDSSVIPGL